MTIRERLESDLAEAMKARNASAVSTLRMLRAALKNADIEKMKPLEDADVVDLLGREAKKLRDAIDSFKTGGRQDLVDQTAAELAMIETYLPAQLGDDELRTIVEEKIAAVGATSAKDFGRVMAEVTKATKGRAEGARVSGVVKDAIGKLGG